MLFIAGYLGYTSGFSLSCMVFFLISVSMWEAFILVKKNFREACLFISFFHPMCYSLHLCIAISLILFTSLFHRSSTRSLTSPVLSTVSQTTPLTTYLFMANVKPNTSPSTSRSVYKQCKHYLNPLYNLQHRSNDYFLYSRKTPKIREMFCM